MILDRELLKYALMGGTILGGGGGGHRDLGEESGRTALAYGEIKLIDISEIADDALIVTASAVGAPAAVDKMVKPKDYVRAVKILENNLNLKVAGIITNENGGAATINGWIQSAVLGIPLIDAPCNGRAHPTGTMGSMGLNQVENFLSLQGFAGGNPELGNYVEGFIAGDLFKASTMVRQAAVQAGGLVAVARNAVTAGYVKEHGAIGGIRHAIDTGRAYYSGLKESPAQAIQAVARFLNGEIIASGEVSDFKLVTEGGFDVGTVIVNGCEMTFWNEYMTLDVDGDRRYTFPDLIMTFDANTAEPLTTAEIESGRNVIILATKKDHLKLGAGMFDNKLLQEIEPIVKREILAYL